MKHTCANCEYYHACLQEHNPTSFYHIHDYCSRWNRVDTCPMRAALNEFLDSYSVDVSAATPDVNVVFDDIETGFAGCYLFEPGDVDHDTKLRENFESNKKAAIATLDYILAVKHYHNELTDERESLEQEDVEYFSDLRSQFGELEYDKA